MMTVDFSPGDPPDHPHRVVISHCWHRCRTMAAATGADSIAAVTAEAVAIFHFNLGAPCDSLCVRPRSVRARPGI